MPITRLLKKFFIQDYADARPCREVCGVGCSEAGLLLPDSPGHTSLLVIHKNFIANRVINNGRRFGLPPPSVITIYFPPINPWACNIVRLKQENTGRIVCR
ncbi:Uncharacterised protein [Klebsiella pneumoniae]|nr:Uncharacterised protein [Klebsiella pneumoniae]SVV32600.1 Uncharacterised protein [Klebsiella pneumoniae]